MEVVIMAADEGLFMVVEEWVNVRYPCMESECFAAGERWWFAGELLKVGEMFSAALLVSVRRGVNTEDGL